MLSEETTRSRRKRRLTEPQVDTSRRWTASALCVLFLMVPLVMLFATATADEGPARTGTISTGH
jgi:hypothetical protein